MMPVAGPPPATFFYWACGVGLITGLIFAYVYNVIKAGVPGSGIWGKGAWYGVLVFLVGGLPGHLAIFLMIHLPKTLIASWAVESLVVSVVGGWIVAWLIK